MISQLRYSNKTFVTAMVILLTLMTGFITYFAITPFQAAVAATGDPPLSGGGEIKVDIGVGGGGGGNTGGGPGGGGGSGGGGGGGGSGPVKPSLYETKIQKCIYGYLGGDGIRRTGYPANTNSTCTVLFTADNKKTYSFKCAARNGNTPAFSVLIKWLKRVNEGVAGGGDTYQLFYTCQYPPYASPNTVLGTKTCFVKYDSKLYHSVDRNTIRSGGALAKVRSGSNQYSNITVGAADYNRCVTSFKATQVYYPATPENGGYGYYRATADNVKAVTCNLLGFPAWVGDPTRNRSSCGGQWTASAVGASYAVYSCSTNFRNVGGWSSLPSGVNFGLTACATFSCTLSGPTTVNGNSAPQDVMRTGENNVINFPTANITSSNGTVRNVTNVQGKTEFISGSSPFNPSAAVNGDKQYFQLRDKDGKTKLNFGVWENQGNNIRNLAFFWSSDSGKNFQMDRTYRFTAQFLVFVADNTGGAGSNQWQTASYTYTPGSSCYTKVAPIEVLRAANQ